MIESFFFSSPSRLSLRKMGEDFMFLHEWKILWTHKAGNILKQSILRNVSTKFHKHELVLMKSFFFFCLKSFKCFLKKQSCIIFPRHTLFVSNLCHVIPPICLPPFLSKRHVNALCFWQVFVFIASSIYLWVFTLKMFVSKSAKFVLCEKLCNL